MRIVFSILLLLLVRNVCSSNELSPQEQRALIQVARGTLEQLLAGKMVSHSQPDIPATSGLFVTLVMDGKVKGCYGSVYPEGSNLTETVRDYTIGAASKDLRHPPVQLAELDRIQIILSFIYSLLPLEDPNHVDPKREGLLARSGNRAAVLLPGEARTASWLYNEALRQAGIRPGTPVELFKLRTLTVYEK